MPQATTEPVTLGDELEAWLGQDGEKRKSRYNVQHYLIANSRTVMQ